MSVETFEAWLAEHDIGIAGQVATGSGDMVRYTLRFVDGTEHDLALKLEALVTRPDEAIHAVEALMEQHDAARQRAGDN